MPYRTFRDVDGTEWTAWDIFPVLAERRNEERRSLVAAGEIPDRRGRDRRIRRGRQATVPSALSNGWLCFECKNERRRLSPIPADWSRCPDGTLSKYCSEARPVPAKPVASTGPQLGL